MTERLLTAMRVRLDHYAARRAAVSVHHPKALLHWNRHYWRAVWAVEYLEGRLSRNGS